MIRWAWTLAAIVLLAGCNQKDPGSAPALDGVHDNPALTPGTYVVTDMCDRSTNLCHEPSAAFDAVGRLVVTEFRGGQVFVLSSNGTVEAWPSPLPAGLEALVQADPQGRIWLTNLVDGFGGAGVTVAQAMDVGNWSEPIAFAHPTPGGIDRQWLAFGPEGPEWMTYRTRTGQAWAVPFDDATFGTPIELANAVSVQGLAGGGRGAVDESGRLYVPMMGQATPVVGLPLADSADSQRAVFVAVVEGGAVSLETVATTEVGDSVAENWPTLALVAGRPMVVWAQLSGGLYTGVREGDGWSAPTLENDGSGASLPWIEAIGASYALAWYEEVDGDPDVLQAMVKLDGVVQPASPPIRLEATDEEALLSQRFPTTDFAMLAVGPDAVALPWYDRPGGLVNVTVLPHTVS